MSTDRELLELAAKAAGYDVDFNDLSSNSRETYYWNETMQTYWNPLIDNSDALLLIVETGIPLMFSPPCVYAGPLWEEMGNDPAAATRRAIVRAAAAMGA